ncbi:hypothetical protein CAL25_20865 [Bordetella genomosp. 5]|uniref:Uncharacterized protein n=1 Tax=Bordetella genomosp. 5 TaxID=1395608 RepID=A0A261T9A9_9BORD|nr:hypothetical protein CAL25_20865 [Bordetella genomosp. 5]
MCRRPENRTDAGQGSRSAFAPSGLPHADIGAVWLLALCRPGLGAVSLRALRRLRLAAVYSGRSAVHFVQLVVRLV